MAELIDDTDDDVPVERRLRLSFVWRCITSDPQIADELEGQLAVGLCFGVQF